MGEHHVRLTNSGAAARARQLRHARRRGDDDGEWHVRHRGDADEPGADDMDVDEAEPESDCIVSRAGSPPPPPPPPPGPGMGRRTVEEPPRAKTRVVVPQSLDLAGTCFDPSGRFVYVATTGGIVEWSVHAAEKMWWHEARWA